MKKVGTFLEILQKINVYLKMKGNLIYDLDILRQREWKIVQTLTLYVAFVWPYFCATLQKLLHEGGNK